MTEEQAIKAEEGENVVAAQEDEKDSTAVDDEDDEEKEENFEWKPYDELMLLNSLYGLKPIGAHYHFMVIIIWEKFRKTTGKNISLSAIKKKLDTYYNFEALDEICGELELPQTDFSLPVSDFPEVYGLPAEPPEPAEVPKVEEPPVIAAGRRRSRLSNN